MNRTSFSGQPATPGDRQIDAARLAENVAEFLARLTDGRCIDERHICGWIGHQHRVEQGLVARLQVRQDKVFLQIVVEICDFGMPSRDLKLHCGDCGREQSLEAVRPPLGLGECCPFVAAWIVQQGVSG
jgi:hypothetical protein